MRARHLTESTIPFYLVNFKQGNHTIMLFGFCHTGMKISRCVYAGVGLILPFSELLIGFVKAAFCRLICLINICRRPQCGPTCLPGVVLGMS